MEGIPKNNQKFNLDEVHKHTPVNTYDMIIFCHLRWDFVYQRPQHIISRLAEQRKVLFVEEPIGVDHGPENETTIIEITSNLHVLKPKVACIEEIASLLMDYLKEDSAPIGWFYSAAFIPLLKSFQFDLIIYDCMDELSLFKGAPQELIDQEQKLMALADIVFTGGKSLYESKRKMHKQVYCFPSSVDEAHFAQALNGIAIPDDIATIEGIIVGYYGVIDERIDLQLLRDTAERSPEVSFVMIGPLAKIHESELPRVPNIHYLGMKSYEELPAYLKAFDISMMPFAINDATKYISPTKTLEYMAAGKPIISTMIKDVVRDFSHCVHLIETPEQFCAAISKSSFSLNHSKTAYRTILKATSWDATTAKMNSLINKLYE
jgi:glycosyltransferase involved in cell wall biosynthesis